MKFFSTSITLAACMGLTLTACKPESIAPERLSFILEQNTQLKKSIIDMQGIIAQAGEPDPSLESRIEQAEKEITNALKELNNLSEQENQAQIRILELETRLSQFRTDFETMQKQVTKLETE